MKRRGDDGFSLIEIVAVMAIYAVVSILGVQILAGAIENRGRAAGAVGETADMVAAVSVMRRDLMALAPVGSETLGGNPIDARGSEFTILTHAAGDPTSFTSVRWSLDPVSSELRRQSDATDGHEIILLDDVASIELRVLGSNGAWIESASWRPADIGELPRAVEVRILFGHNGDVRLVVAR